MRTGHPHVATAVFDGAKEDGDRARNSIEQACPESGQTVLFDGRTGEPFDVTM